MPYRDDKIRAVMGARRITITELAASTNLSRQSVSAVVDGTAEDPKLSTLTKIASALNISLPDLFELRIEERVAPKSEELGAA